MANYERATEYGIADAERQLAMADPSSLDIGLLYALRISVCLPQIKNLNTLASRYNTACIGAGGRGLLASKNSLYYQKTCDFLAEQYLSKFAELADDMLEKTKDTACKRKTKQAKLSVWNNAKSKLAEAANAFEYKLPKIDSVVEALEKHIDEEVNNIDKMKPISTLPVNSDAKLGFHAGYRNGVPFGFDDQTEVLKGYRCCATMQLTTPLKYLEMHGQFHRGPASELPVILLPHGIWLPEVKSWKELGINLKEAPEGTMASDIGPIPASGGQYLEFLKAFRKIVESKMNPEQKKDAIFLLGTDNDYFASILSIHTVLQGDKLNQWLGYDEILGISGFNPTLAKALYEAGFHTADAIKSASDKELCSVKGIGQAKVKKIRELQNQITK